MKNKVKYMYNIKNTYKQLKEIMKQGEIKLQESLSQHTSFKIGGPADFVVLPKTLEEFIRLVLFLKKQHIPYYVLGNGTNVLASDQGFEGVIIKTTNYKGITKSDHILEVLAGTSLNRVGLFAKEHSLQGLEEGAGIPGTIGGAVIMNASAYGFETQEVILGVLAMVEGKIKYFTNEECQFAYRNSVFKNYPDCIILRVDCVLKEGNEAEILQKREEILLKRKTNQPLNWPSAGSVFKRLDGVIVSKLLDEEGFKGYTLNGAQVSDKHAGFIINIGDATAKDVRNLINHIKTYIKEKHNIELVEEIKYLGKF